jgi:hypothetical protein
VFQRWGIVIKRPKKSKWFISMVFYIYYNGRRSPLEHHFTVKRIVTFKLNSSHSIYLEFLNEHHLATQVVKMPNHTPDICVRLLQAPDILEKLIGLRLA